MFRSALIAAACTLSACSGPSDRARDYAAALDVAALGTPVPASGDCGEMQGRMGVYGASAAQLLLAAAAERVETIRGADGAEIGADEMRDISLAMIADMAGLTADLIGACAAPGYRPLAAPAAGPVQADGTRTTTLSRLKEN